MEEVVKKVDQMVSKEAAKGQKAGAVWSEWRCGPYHVTGQDVPMWMQKSIKEEKQNVTEMESLPQEGSEDPNHQVSLTF